MTEPRRWQLIDVSLLLLVLAVAAGARGWYLLDSADSGRNSGPIRVQDLSPQERDTLVRNLKDNGTFSGPTPLNSQEERTAFVAPGYPWLLSLAQLLPEPDRTVRWVQVALGSLTAALYFLFTRRAFRSLPVAALAGMFCALHPFWVVSAAELEDGVLAAFLLALALWLGVRAGQSGGALTSLLFGLTLAGLALVRAALLPLGFVAVLWLIWRCRSLPRGWLYALLAFLGFANGLVPWTLRNYQATGDVVPIVDSAWWHLWVGNNPDTTGGPEPAQPPQSLADVPPDQRQKRLAEEVIAEVQRDPAATLNRRLWAGLAFVFGREWLSNPSPWQPTASVSEIPSWLADSYRAILIGTLLGMLLLAFGGWRWTYAWRREAMPAALAVVWLPLPYLLSHAEKLVGPRLPLDGVLLCFAAFVLVALLPRVGTRLRKGPTSHTLEPPEPSV
jgi:4-amino-4-deoxy-L-arabinose transferase-like glycosyltransferase